ncbi:conserved hypothetical protein, secreted [Candidatus Magnetomorum sp. HK-1]|nr:conserved hypothetical protein, secreted [Candidatus Magnetomorum sp. HK-1]
MKLKRRMNKLAIFALIVPCIFFSCISPTSQQKQQTIQQEQETNQQKQQNITDVTDLESNYNRPCWLNTKPEDCPDIMNITGDWIFFRDKIVTQKFSEEITKKQNLQLKSQLMGKYCETLKSKIKSVIKYHETCINEETKEQCNKLYSEKINLISDCKTKSNEIEIFKYYWEETKNSGEWFLFGLGRIDKSIYKKKLNFVLETEKAISNIQKQPIAKTDIQQLKPISSPSEITEVTDSEKIKSIQDEEEKEGFCNNVKIDYIPLPEQVTNRDCISLIQQKLQNIYSQRQDGFYMDKRVLDMNSECLKTQHGCSEDRYQLKVEDEVDKKYSRIVNCWQKQIKKSERDYFHKRKNALMQFKKAHHNSTRFEHLLSEWSYEIDLQIFNNEQKNLIEQIYLQKKQLLNAMFLVFTIANAKYSDINLQVIKKYSVKLARNEIIKQSVEYNVLKNIILEQGNTRNEHLQVSYNIRVEPDYFSPLELMPDLSKAIVMKFKVGLSLNTTKMLNNEEFSELKALKAQSFIIAGNEDIELDENLNAINQAQMKNESYYNWKHISEKNGIRIKEQQRNTIQRLINEVINENIETQKTSRRYQIDYEIDKRKIQTEIDSNVSKIREINEDLSSMLNSIQVLPMKINDYNNKNKILEEVRNKYSNYLINEAQQKELAYENLNNVQLKTVQRLIDSSFDGEYPIRQASQKIEQILHNSQDEFCSGARVGSIEIQNNKTINEESKVENIRPVLVGYQLPVIIIKHDKDQAKMTIPILLRVRCESIQKLFSYDEQSNVINDLTTNISWEIQTNRYPRRRIGETEDWVSPRFITPELINQYLTDYNTFCSNYQIFYQKISNKYIYQNYPEFKCMKRFNVYKTNNIKLIRDMLKEEEWKVIPDISYNDLLANVKNSDWQINTIESLVLFYNELKLNLKNERNKSEIIDMLSNKYFWTSSEYSTRTLSTIMLDFEKDTLEKPKPKHVKGIGIVTRGF